MSLERTDRGTTSETGNGQQPKDQAPPPKDTSGEAPRGQADSQRTSEQNGSPENRNTGRGQRPEQPTTGTGQSVTPRMDSRRAYAESSEQPARTGTRGPGEAPKGQADSRGTSEQNGSSDTANTGRGQRPEQSATRTGESVTPRMDSRTAYAQSSEQPARGGTGGTILDRDGEDQAGDDPKQGPGEEPRQASSEAPRPGEDRSPTQEPREPDAGEGNPESTETQGDTSRLPETSDGAPRLGEERSGEDAGEQLGPPPETGSVPEGNRGSDGSWSGPQEQTRADDGREPLVPEQQGDPKGPPETGQPVEPAADTERERPDEPPEAGQDEKIEPTAGAADTESSTDPPGPPDPPGGPPEPAPHDDSPVGVPRAYVADGKVKWLLMPDLELQGSGYEGPRSADAGDPLEPVDEETDLGRDPENPKRQGELARAFNDRNHPDDVVKDVNKAAPKVEHLLGDKPPTGVPGSIKDTSPEMYAPPHQAQYGSVGMALLAIGAIIVQGSRLIQNTWNERRARGRDSS
jgi:hypothetical protein